MGGFSPNTLVWHDYGGTPQNAPGMFNPYHALVFPDGSIKYRNPENPYGQPAPHAYHLNPQSIGLSYAGPVGSQPTPAAMDTLKNESIKIAQQFPGITPMSHGEAFNATRGTPLQASMDGRGLDEASWRSQLLYGPPAPGQTPAIAQAPSVPVSDRGLTAYAGMTPKAQPGQQMTLGGPMPAPQQPEETGGNPFIDGLAARMQSPLFMGGLGMLVAANQGRDAVQGMAQGVQAGQAGIRNQADIMKMNREAMRQKIMDDFWANIKTNPAFKNMPSELMATVAGLPPDQAGQVLGNYISRRGDVQQMGEIARQNAQIELEKSDALAKQNQARMFDTMRSIRGMGSNPSRLPAPGAVEDGYRFKGGNPADPNSWEKQ